MPRGSDISAGLWSVVGAGFLRQQRRIEDGVPEQDDLDRHGARQAALRVPALGKTVENRR